MGKEGMSIFEQCCIMFDAGMSTSEVLKANLHFPPHTVKCCRYKWSKGIRPVKNHKPKEGIYFSLFEGGKSVREVMDIMGTAPQTVYKYYGLWRDSKLQAIRKEKAKKTVTFRPCRIRDSGGVVFDKTTRTDTIWRTA